MLIFLSSLAIIAIAVYLAKRIFIKKLRGQYEKSLLKGDRKKSDELGKMYYLSLDDATRKARGIIDIDAKISDDFRSLNHHHYSLLF
jgi:hypothetical protein